MTVDAARTTAPEAAQITLDDDYDVLYWTARLYCTASQLRAAVGAVGPRVIDVRLYLREADR